MRQKKRESGEFWDGLLELMECLNIEFINSGDRGKNSSLEDFVWIEKRRTEDRMFYSKKCENKVGF